MTALMNNSRRSVAQRVYRLALRAYPAAFRARYANEIADVFGQGLEDARQIGRGAAALYQFRAWTDLFWSVGRERLALVHDRILGVYIAAVAGGSYATYVDFHATEVQPTLLVFVVSGFVLGSIIPQRAWRRALVLAALLPASQVIAFALRHGEPARGHPYLSRFMIFLPALAASLIGTYAGVLVRYLCRAARQWLRHDERPGSSSIP